MESYLLALIVVDTPRIKWRIDFFYRSRKSFHLYVQVNDDDDDIT